MENEEVQVQILNKNNVPVISITGTAMDVEINETLVYKGISKELYEYIPESMRDFVKKYTKSLLKELVIDVVHIDDDGIYIPIHILDEASVLFIPNGCNENSTLFVKRSIINSEKFKILGVDTTFAIEKILELKEVLLKKWGYELELDMVRKQHNDIYKIYIPYSIFSEINLLECLSLISTYNKEIIKNIQKRTCLV